MWKAGHEEEEKNSSINWEKYEVSWNFCLVLLIFKVVYQDHLTVASLCKGFHSERAVAGLGQSGLRDFWDQMTALEIISFSVTVAQNEQRPFTCGWWTELIAFAYLFSLSWQIVQSRALWCHSHSYF